MESVGIEPKTKSLQVTCATFASSPYVVMGGFEPPTLSVSGNHSTAELHDNVVDTEGLEPPTLML